MAGSLKYKNKENMKEKKHEASSSFAKKKTKKQNTLFQKTQSLSTLPINKYLSKN